MISVCRCFCLSHLCGEDLSPNEILLALFVAFLGYAQWGNAHLGVLEF